MCFFPYRVLTRRNSEAVGLSASGPNKVDSQVQPGHESCRQQLAESVLAMLS